MTLLEYGDFECPYCGQAERIIRELLAGAGEDLRYVFRHLPLNDVHANAETAAEAAEAAAAQGAFWAMHDVLLAHQEELTMPDLLRYAGELGLDVKRFAREVRDRRPRRAHRARRRERRRERRVRDADVLRQRPAPPGRLRRRHAHGRGSRGQAAGALRRRGVHRSLTAADRPLVVARRLQINRVA